MISQTNYKIIKHSKSGAMKCPWKLSSKIFYTESPSCHLTNSVKALKAQNKETSSVHPSSSPKTAARLTVAPMPRPYYFGPNGIV